MVIIRFAHFDYARRPSFHRNSPTAPPPRRVACPWSMYLSWFIAPGQSFFVCETFARGQNNNNADRSVASIFGNACVRPSGDNDKRQDGGVYALAGDPAEGIRCRETNANEERDRETGGDVIGWNWTKSSEGLIGQDEHKAVTGGNGGTAIYHCLTRRINGERVLLIAAANGP